MGHKIFVSYKYKDNSVQALPSRSWGKETTVRSYVDILQEVLSLTDHTNKGEHDDDDLSGYSQDYIWELLKDRIFDSTVTIVMASPNMRIKTKSDASQWIPWEISFSLRETRRNDRASHTNAVLAIVLPDRQGSYDYYTQWITYGSLRGFMPPFNGGMFAILRNNMLNRKKTLACSFGTCNNERSYIKSVRWDVFMRSPNTYIETALDIQRDAACYDIKKEV